MNILRRMRHSSAILKNLDIFTETHMQDNTSFHFNCQQEFKKIPNTIEEHRSVLPASFVIGAPESKEVTAVIRRSIYTRPVPPSDSRNADWLSPLAVWKNKFLFQLIFTCNWNRTFTLARDNAPCFWSFKYLNLDYGINLNLKLNLPLTNGQPGEELMALFYSRNRQERWKLSTVGRY